MLLQRIYAALLHLYPSAFRDEFADEMHRDFSHALADAHKHGTFALISLLARELRDLPAAALREHRRTRSSSPMENNPRSSLRELLCAALPFLLYLAIPGASFVQEYWAVLVRLLLIGALIVLAIVGLTKGVPRWSLPVLGLSLAIVNYVLLNLVDPNFNPYASLPPWLRQLLAPSLSSVGILALTLIVVFASAAFGPWRPFFQRLRQDYTLLPFALYGAMPIFKLLSFNEYEGDVPYVIGMGLVFLAGLWLYLRSVRPGIRLFALALAITLAAVIEALGKWILVPSQDWGMWFQWHTIQEAQQIEVASVAAHWLWTMIIVFLPALLGVLPRPARFEASVQT